MGTPLSAVRDFLVAYEHYYIVSHVDPDADCLGSQIGMKHLLSSLGRTCTLVSDGPFERPEIRSLAGHFTGDIAAIRDGSALIVLDCSTRDRIGRFADVFAALPVLVIDHHSHGTPFGDLLHIDPTSPAVTEMITSLYRVWSIPIPEEAARMLFLGLCTDTGFFRHIKENMPRAFIAAADLVASGASPQESHGMIFGGKPLAARLLLGRMLDTAEILYGGAVVIVSVPQAVADEFGPDSRDNDSLYQLVMGSRECRLLVLLREDRGETSVSFRSKEGIDVGELAGRFGGGGHMRAAGFTASGSLSEAKTRILSEIGKLF